MNEIIVLLGLVLGLSVVQKVVFDLVPFRAPAALTTAVGVAMGAGLAWALDYSAFAALGQQLRAEWMEYAMTGVVLIAFGEFVRSIVTAIAHRAGEPPVEAAPAPQHIRVA